MAGLDARPHRHMDQDEPARTWPKTRCTWSAQGANRRSFDYASRDETARGCAQHDNIIFIKHNHSIYMLVQPLGCPGPKKGCLAETAERRPASATTWGIVRASEQSTRDKVSIIYR
jgi:hypothetical protein